MEIITIRLPIWMIKAIDDLVQQGLYPNRSEFIREAIRSHLRRYAKQLERRYILTLKQEIEEEL